MSLPVLFKYSLYFGKKKKYVFYQLSFRYGVSFKNISSVSKSVTEAMTSPWTATTLPTIVSRYPLENIFNAEFSTNVYQIKHCIWKEKSAQQEITVKSFSQEWLLVMHMAMFVIGKASKPRLFKGVRNLPWHYRAQCKSWMTAKLFEEWVRQLDQKFSAANRKIALTIDNCTAHSHV